jgi:hypothetical protein
MIRFMVGGSFSVLSPFMQSSCPALASDKSLFINGLLGGPAVVRASFWPTVTTQPGNSVASGFFPCVAPGRAFILLRFHHEF